jgi:DNA recombination protein RmuC
MIDILLALLVIAVVLLLWQALRFATLQRRLVELCELSSKGAEERHRAMLVDMHDGLAKQGERVGGALADSSERLRAAVTEELLQARSALHALRLGLAQDLSDNRAAMLDKLNATAQSLASRIDERLDQISGRVNERLEEGFKKTNETFVNVMQRLATIDEAQKKIDGLTTNVVSLQELLGD